MRRAYGTQTLHIFFRRIKIRRYKIGRAYGSEILIIISIFKIIFL